MGCLTDLKADATPLQARLGCTYDAEPQVLRVTRNGHESGRANEALIVKSDESERPNGYGAYVSFDRRAARPPLISIPAELDYLDEGDIVRINPRQGHVWVMYRRASKFNALLLTERCNSWCVMCSQPPKASDDDLLVRDWLDAIPLMSPETTELGFTGGEPTLLGDQFLQLIAACRDYLPSTALHVLSNGRLFNYLSLALSLKALGHPNLVIGIPLYCDIAWLHDFIVQAPGAFDQTIRGLLNLARCNVRIELRIVIHKYSVDRLPELATFISRNLPFVEHVAIMGLEPIGFAKSNLRVLWVDPIDYHHQLITAANTLAGAAMNVSIYNHQLCVLPPELWPFNRQSISDWKNIFLPICHECKARQRCGGFFHSASAAHSRSIHPIDIYASI